MKKNIALTGWWTWWHIFPLISIYNYLKKDNSLNFYYFWDEEWIEYKISTQNNIPFFHIPSGKIRRYFDIRNFYEPTKNLTWIFYWIYYILKYKIDIIVSKWWFAWLPLCIAWFILRKKIYIHESDTNSGIANKIISKIATKVFYSFPNKEIDWIKHILTWQIVNPELYIDIDKNELLEENERLEVLVVAWSQWSTAIFENLKSVLNNLIDINFTIVLWTKNAHFKKEFESYKNVELIDFATQKQMWEIYKKTDIAITRAWATTLFELYFFWIHSIIIPLPSAANWHQISNAKYFKEEFWSDVLQESENLWTDIYRCLSKYKELRKSWLNMTWVKYALEQIKKEIM